MQYYYITGTSSGLGKAIAEQLLQRSNTVVIGIARHKSIEHENYIHFFNDLSSPDATEAFQFGHHDTATSLTLINNAGITGDIKYAGALRDQDIFAGYNVNIVASHILCNKFIREYRNRDIPKLIINVTSGAASSPYDGWSVYCATKAALDMMSLCLAKEFEFQKDGFRIFSIAPNVMDTKMQDRIRETDVRDFSRKQKFSDLHEQNKLYAPADVARKYLEMMDNADMLKGVIHRIEL